MTETAGRTEPTGIWVYAVAGRSACPGPLTGVGGAPVATTTAAGLTAVTERVPLDEFGEAALHRNLEDLGWLEKTARAHHTVIDAVAQHGPVVPMRLATVYRSEAGVTALLTRRGADFRALLDRIRTRVEWGVKAWAAQPAAFPAGAGDAAGSAAEPAGAGAGAAYLNRRRHERSAQETAREEAMKSVACAHTALSALAADARLHPPQAPQLHGNRAPMLLNAAYLLDAEMAESFAAAVRRLAADHPRVQYELTGPWPPYSFAELPEEPAQAADRDPA